jgi:hypothetical protein
LNITSSAARGVDRGSSISRSLNHLTVCCILHVSRNVLKMSAIASRTFGGESIDGAVSLAVRGGVLYVTST